MEHVFFTATFWLGLAVIAAIIAYHLKVSIALMEICIGAVVAALANQLGFTGIPGVNEEWLKFLASAGACFLTFLAGAELEPQVMREKIKEANVIGLIGFFSPFIGCSIVARYVLGWDLRASLLAGVALSTTSIAVVYSVMLETGLNRTEFGKGILAACFINDLGTVIALGLIFAPFTHKTVIFLVLTVLMLIFLPHISNQIRTVYAGKTAAIRTKWIAMVLFGLGAFAFWAGSEAVLPAYLVGMVLAEFSISDNFWLKRIRTLTTGFLTPFYFLRAGTLVNLSSLLVSPLIFFVLLSGKVISKIFGLYPFIAIFRQEKNERWFYTLMMSTGLTFGTISALYGLTNGIVTQTQYSFLVTAVIGSAVVPTLIANIMFFPRHLLAETAPREPLEIAEETLADE
ncbi:MAG: cation:proton antiporter [Deltaproteobacteria bacterium]|nr:cation:proton antiporter [Deltaproteobacteria bacterium]